MSPDANYLADRIAIMDVMVKYGTAVDAREMDRYRSCFTADLTVVGYGGDDMEGADTYLEYVIEALKNFPGTQHLMGNQVVEFGDDTRDPQTAHVNTEVQATHFLKEDPDAIMTLWATYVDDMVRDRGGQWRIKRHELVRRGSQRTVNQP